MVCAHRRRSKEHREYELVLRVLADLPAIRNSTEAEMPPTSRNFSSYPVALNQQRGEHSGECGPVQEMRQGEEPKKSGKSGLEAGKVESNTSVIRSGYSCVIAHPDHHREPATREKPFLCSSGPRGPNRKRSRIMHASQTGGCEAFCVETPPLIFVIKRLRATKDRRIHTPWTT